MLLLAIDLAPAAGLAQTSSTDRQKTSIDRERAREEREWREIHRTQKRMRDLDDQRSLERQRQNADWRREMDERNQPNQPTPPTRPAQPAATPRTRPQQSTAPYTPPPAPSTSGSTAAPSSTCSARPVCMAASGRANVCTGVQSSYSGSRQAGLADIARRCREANTPDPCAQERRRSPAAPSYKLDAVPALSCSDQCVKVARCEPAASR